jgi:lysozyme
MTKGIDVSHWNNRIHWPQVPHDDQEITFAMAKATEGETFQDFRFIENFDEMKENNIHSGAYHVFRMTSTPDGQVKNITKILEKAKFD